MASRQRPKKTEPLKGDSVKSQQSLPQWIRHFSALRRASAFVRPFLCCAIALSFSAKAHPIQAQTAPQYWPLAVGNKWVYEGESRFIGTPESGPVRTRLEPITLEVVAREIVEGNSYFRLNNGHLLRFDQQRNIIAFDTEFDVSRPNEFIFFHLNAGGDFLQDTVAVASLSLGEHVLFYFFNHSDDVFFRSPLGIVPPQSVYRNFQSTRRTLKVLPIETPVGVFEQWIDFSHSYFGTDCSSIFVVNVGPIGSSCGNDTDFVGYRLIEATINGQRLHPTAVPASSWGQIKEPR